MTAHDFAAGLPTKRVAADCLIFDAAGRVLVVEPTYKATWDLPGGVVEPNESPRAAALREVQEEVGIQVTPGPLLVVDWVARTDDASEVMALMFDAGITDIDANSLDLQSDEIRSAAFVAAEELSGLLDPEAARRVAAAIDARSSRGTVYLENGRSVP